VHWKNLVTLEEILFFGSALEENLVTRGTILYTLYLLFTGGKRGNFTASQPSILTTAKEKNILLLYLR